MLFRQYFQPCLSHLSYLIADERAAVAAVVDPQRDVQQYLDTARELGLTIQYCLLTHFHSDFVAGHLELAERTGACIVLGQRARAEYRFTELGDGDGLTLGAVRLDILETPGHTPESISILIYDTARDPETPYGVLTGDTLFINDVGRPDLASARGGHPDEMADQLFDSLHQKLLVLPDETLVYPAHAAGSLCGKHLSPDRVSTMFVQRRTNYAVQPMSREEFRRLVLADQPEAPPYFAYDAKLNRQCRATLDEVLEDSLVPLGFDELLEMQRSGAQILDIRPAAEFEQGFLAGSINIPLERKFTTWAGTVLLPEKPIVIVGDDRSEREAILRLGRIGFDRVVGYLEHGAAPLIEHPAAVGHIDRILPQQLAHELDEHRPLSVIDVRTQQEYQHGHIEGSHNIPLSHLREHLDEVPRDQPVVVHCETGYRSAIGASLLKQAGIEHVADLVGGFSAWESTHASTH